MEKILTRLYTTPGQPTAYSSVKKLFDAARKEIPYLTIEQVREFLKTQRTYTLFKPVVRNFKRLRTVPSGWHSDWQCDLMVFTSIARKNGGMKYLLVVEEVLSRYLFVEPVRTKRSDDMIDAFEKIFQKTPALPWRLYSDSGLEFCSQKMREFFKKKTIQKVEARTNIVLHAAMVERANRTIRDRLKRYFCEHNTFRWVDVIENLVDGINNSVHSTTQMTPASVNAKNAEKLFQKLYAKPEKLEKPKFKVGDYVRTANFKHTFSKGSTTFSDEISIIAKVLAHRSPTVYLLKDRRDEPLIGYFYTHELCPASINTTFRIEKVLRSRLRNNEREYYVKWMGFSSNYNSWISANDLV